MPNKRDERDLEIIMFGNALLAIGKTIESSGEARRLPNLTSFTNPPHCVFERCTSPARYVVVAEKNKCICHPDKPIHFRCWQHAHRLDDCEYDAIYPLDMNAFLESEANDV